MISSGKALKLDYKSEGAVQVAVLDGPIDEGCAGALAGLVKPFTVLDLQGISRMNSAGATLWVKWARGPVAQMPIIIRNMSTAFTRVAGVLPEVVPPAWSIESFLVPYADTDNDISKSILFGWNRNFNDKICKIPLRIPNPDGSGGQLEIDAYPEIYFQFLTARFKGMVLEKV